MTLYERFLIAKENCDFSDRSKNGINELVAYAYYLGRHEAAVECCEEARKIFDEQLKRARTTSFYRVAEKVQGGIEGIYHSDYSGDFVNMFRDEKLTEEFEGVR